MLEKIYFKPGDLVTLKQDIPNKPVMIVTEKKSKTFRLPNNDNKAEYFIGMKCRWFTSSNELQEAI